MRSHIIAFLIIAALPAQLGAQTPPEPCTYDRCALRIEGNRIVRGAAGARVGTMGVFTRPRLVNHVGQSDSALAHARIFQRNHGSGTAMLLLGITLASGAGTYLLLNAAVAGEDASLVVPAAMVAGIGLEIAGALRIQRALNAASRAIWWYNRDLPRD